MKSIASPFTPGADSQWFVRWLIAVSVIAVGLFFLPGFVRISVALTIVATVAIALLSGVLLPLLLAAWLVLVVYAWGTWLLRLANVEPEDPIQSIALAVPLGFVVPAAGMDSFVDRRFGMALRGGDDCDSVPDDSRAAEKKIQDRHAAARCRFSPSPDATHRHS